jgi:hypothetical protein
MGPSQISLKRDEDHSAPAPPYPPTEVEQKFRKLRDEWKAKRGHHSETAKLVIHPAYQQIIGIGPDAIGLILRELEVAPDRWYWALRAITGEDPVPPSKRGDSEAMTHAWLDWGRSRGYL